MKYLNTFVWVLGLLTLFSFGHRPAHFPENIQPFQVENITDVILTFTSLDSTEVIVARAQDSDGEGPGGFEIIDDITLGESTEYTLSVSVQDSINGIDLTTDIIDNAIEQLLFFEWSEGVFDNPNGDGNIDDRDDPVNYNDEDENGLPLGLATSWISACVDTSTMGSFRIVLKEQVDAKTPESSAEVGETLFDITWDITIEDDPSAPPCENEEEIITDVTLTFAPVAGGDTVVVTAQDPDGEGPMDLQIVDQIELLESTEYTLSIELLNAIEGEDITEEISEEDEEHMFFFAWTDDVFDSPNGDGNIDNREDPVNYNDEDEDGLPVGLSTSWTAACVDENISGEFRVVLKHQPDIKSATSTFEDGGTDVDLTFDISVIDDPSAPPCENEEEVITDVTLTFAPVAGGDTVVVTAQDPDGEGPMDLQIVDQIGLSGGTEYTLSVELLNAIEGEDITEEISEEDEEHMFFFAWTGDIFASPEGDGNIDNREDPVNYNDEDENGLPVGLSTSWTTLDSIGTGTFRIVLKHQPDIKSATSTFEDGGTDIDLTFEIGSIATSSRKTIQDNSALIVSPNPTRDILSWSIEGVNLDQISIYDRLGRLIVAYPQPQTKLNVSDLAPGMYILKAENTRNIWTRRFIVTR